MKKLYYRFSKKSELGVVRYPQLLITSSFNKKVWIAFDLLDKIVPTLYLSEKGQT